MPKAYLLMAAKLRGLRRIENAFYILAACINNTGVISGRKGGQIPRFSPYIFRCERHTTVSADTIYGHL